MKNFSLTIFHDLIVKCHKHLIIYLLSQPGKGQGLSQDAWEIFVSLGNRRSRVSRFRSWEAVRPGA